MNKMIKSSLTGGQVRNLIKSLIMFSPGIPVVYNCISSSKGVHTLKECKLPLEQAIYDGDIRIDHSGRYALLFDLFDEKSYIVTGCIQWPTGCLAKDDPIGNLAMLGALPIEHSSKGGLLA